LNGVFDSCTHLEEGLKVVQRDIKITRDARETEDSGDTHLTGLRNKQLSRRKKEGTGGKVHRGNGVQRKQKDISRFDHAIGM